MQNEPETTLDYIIVCCSLDGSHTRNVPSQTIRSIATTKARMLNLGEQLFWVNFMFYFSLYCKRSDGLFETKNIRKNLTKYGLNSILSHLHVNYSRVSENNSRNFERKSSKANSAQKSYLPKKRVSLLKKFSRKHLVSGSFKNWTFLNFSRLKITSFRFAWNYIKNISFAKIHYLFFYCCKMHLSSSESFENKWTFFVSYLTQKWQNSFIFQRKVNGLFVGRKRRMDATILIWIFCDSFAYTLEVRKCA